MPETPRAHYQPQKQNPDGAEKVSSKPAHDGRSLHPGPTASHSQCREWRVGRGSFEPFEPFGPFEPFSSRPPLLERSERYRGSAGRRILTRRVRGRGVQTRRLRRAPALSRRPEVGSTTSHLYTTRASPRCRGATAYARPTQSFRKFGGAMPPRVFRPCVRVALNQLRRFEPEAHVVPSQHLHARTPPEYERRRISRPPGVPAAHACAVGWRASAGATRHRGGARSESGAEVGGSRRECLRRC